MHFCVSFCVLKVNQCSFLLCFSNAVMNQFSDSEVLAFKQIIAPEGRFFTLDSINSTVISQLTWMELASCDDTCRLTISNPVIWPFVDPNTIRGWWWVMSDEWWMLDWGDGNHTESLRMRVFAQYFNKSHFLIWYSTIITKFRLATVRDQPLAGNCLGNVVAYSSLFITWGHDWSDHTNPNRCFDGLFLQWVEFSFDVHLTM